MAGEVEAIKEGTALAKEVMPIVKEVFGMFKDMMGIFKEGAQTVSSNTQPSPVPVAATLETAAPPAVNISIPGMGAVSQSIDRLAAAVERIAAAMEKK